jgi:hypothetical protein
MSTVHRAKGSIQASLVQQTSAHARPARPYNHALSHTPLPPPPTFPSPTPPDCANLKIYLEGLFLSSSQFYTYSICSYESEFNGRSILSLKS